MPNRYVFLLLKKIDFAKLTARLLTESTYTC